MDKEDKIVEDATDASPGGFNFDNTYASQLEGLYEPSRAAGFPAPELIRFNPAVARELGLDEADLPADVAAAVFSGNVVPEGAAPLAQAYAGHQFGGFSPSLGDGRALLLGEIVDARGQRRDVQLKGSGPTPFSCGGDGKATLGPVLREYLMGEAMHALGIPTTRGLAAVSTGEAVRRERLLPGAVLARVASSHIRVGTFEYFTAREQTEELRRLAEYTIARHYPELKERDRPYLELVRSVSRAQATLVAQWMHVGFVHGVMNTDNTTISGETIDYGPCAFMDVYARSTVFSSIDKRGRYAYGNQPGIANWNIARFAESLLPLIDPDAEQAIALAQQVVAEFGPLFEHAWLDGMRGKLGLAQAKEGDQALAEDLLLVMAAERVDFTAVFRWLSTAVENDARTAGPFDNADALSAWYARWQARLAVESREHGEVAHAMNRVNPLYIPRNHRVEAALDAAVDEGDFGPFDALLEVVVEPFVERPGLGAYAEPAPAGAEPYRTFCGT